MHYLRLYRKSLRISYIPINTNDGTSKYTNCLHRASARRPSVRAGECAAGRSSGLKIPAGRPIKYQLITVFIYTGCFSKKFFLLSIKIPERREEFSEKSSFYQPAPAAEKDSFAEIPFHQEFSEIKSPDRGEKFSRIRWNQLVPGFFNFY